MLVSHNKKFIYLKTKKTASTSIERYFRQYCAPIDTDLNLVRPDLITEQGIVSCYSIKQQVEANPEKYPEYLRKDSGTFDSYYIGPRLSETGELNLNDFSFFEHAPAFYIKPIIDKLYPDIWNNYLKIGSIRNPYDYLISSYYYYTKLRNMNTKVNGFYSDHILGDIVGNQELIRNLFKHWLEDYYPLVFKQSDIITLDNKVCLDFVIRYENLLEDMQTLCDKLDVEWDPLKFENALSHIRPEWATVEFMYNEEAKEIVENLFEFELKEFNYSFPTLEITQ